MACVTSCSAGGAVVVMVTRCPPSLVRSIDRMTEWSTMMHLGGGTHQRFLGRCWRRLRGGPGLCDGVSVGRPNWSSMALDQTTTAELILGAARRRLLDEGYAALSTRKVAAEAGVPLSQLH